MALSQDTSCLYSTVKNISGGTKKFGFLPPHGKELDNNIEFTTMGTVSYTHLTLPTNREV